MQSMDWQTLVARRAKKDPPSEGGWHAFLTTSASVDLLNPVTTSFLNASCGSAAFGWPCDAEIERLRGAFTRAVGAEAQMGIVQALQRRVAEQPTHIHLGQWYGPGGVRRNVKGIIPAPLPVLWNVAVD
jgi:peptide/nickel transport system substrate-binding protein